MPIRRANMIPEIVPKQRDRKTNPARCNKPERSSAETDARSAAVGRSLVITLDVEWEKRPEEMDCSKRGRPCKHSDLPMGGIAYPRHMIGNGARVTEGMVGEMPGKGVKGPDHVTVWRRACARAVRIDGDRVAAETADGKTHCIGGRLYRHDRHRQGRADRAQVEGKMQLHQAPHAGRRGVPEDASVSASPTRAGAAPRTCRA